MNSGVEVNLQELLQLRHHVLNVNLGHHKKLTTVQYGQYLSSQRGRGMDFAETRAYHPGDDIRTMNWRVTARTGEPHTKVYQQERERPVFIVSDFTHTMFFGTKVAFKSVIAARVAAMIAWSAAHQKDRVGGIIFNNTSEVILRPQSSFHGVIALLKQISVLAQKTSQTTTNDKNRLLASLKILRRIAKSGSLIYVISDFYDGQAEIEKELQFLGKHHEVFNVFVYDHLETEPPTKGKYLFHSLTDDSLLFNANDVNLRAKYSELFNQRLTWLKKLQTNFGMQLIEVATHEDISQVLKQKLNVRR